jgi:outer membrane protein OmpA-like peptidoglycan-associated protein
MKLKSLFISQDDQDDQWISIADMMAGLMVVFLFIAIINLKSQYDKIKTFEILQDNIYNKLYEEFKDDLEKWTAEIDKDTLTVSFREPRIQFDTGSSVVKDKFKLILNDFFPRYLDVLYEFYQNIDEIRIEGHTSSKWETALSQDDIYIENMILSQERAIKVLIYSLNLNLGINKGWAKNLIAANGMSFSKLILTSEDLEDEIRSQRTEFRVKVDSKNFIINLRKYFKESIKVEEESNNTTALESLDNNQIAKQTTEAQVKKKKNLFDIIKKPFSIIFKPFKQQN